MRQAPALAIDVVDHLVECRGDFSFAFQHSRDTVVVDTDIYRLLRRFDCARRVRQIENRRRIGTMILMARNR